MITELKHKVFNWIWFWAHQKQYKAFKKKVIDHNYNPKDIFYSYKIGFLCWPPIPFNEELYDE